MRRDFCFSGSWQRAIPTRILVVLVGLWLCIAPQWHLCEDSGLIPNSGQAPGSVKSACCLKPIAAQAKVATPHTQSHINGEAPNDKHGVTFCLARYLEFFPLLSAAAFAFLALISFVALRFRTPIRFALLCPAVYHASRGPPCFSF